QIRGGLHTLGRPPEGDAEIDLLAALLRLPQGPVPSLRAAVADGLGLDLASLLAEPGRRLDPSEKAADPAGAWVTASDAIDIAEALALLGARPVWAEESGRVVGVEPVPLEELGRPRVDVTLRISGFFRDAFPHLVHLVDEAVELVRHLDEPPEQNFVRANGDDHRIFGAKPGAYGSGILALLDSKDWVGDDDLATVYLAW